MSLNQKLGIEIAGEGIPMISHPDSSKRYWSAVSLPWTSIGYELHLTPLQTLSFYNAIANNGVMVKPMFVKAIMHAGRTIKSFEPQVINSRICSQATIDSARSLLEGVVERGTATLLKNKHYKVAGKTGTAQIADRNRGYEQKIYNATFVGYFPADNPKYSCIVVVNDPAQGKYYGGSVAAPVFREIADKVYATHLDIYQETENEITDESVPRIMYGNHDDISWLCQELDIPVSRNSDIAEWIVTVREDESIRFAPRVIRDQQVPNVRGMSARDAVYILEQLGMSIKLQGRGKVTSQSVEPGSRISKGQEITLRLSEKG
jgi:cell division protein FtsI (penicillin-binding protein 3)